MAKRATKKTETTTANIASVEKTTGKATVAQQAAPQAAPQPDAAIDVPTKKAPAKKRVVKKRVAKVVTESETAMPETVVPTAEQPATPGPATPAKETTEHVVSQEPETKKPLKREASLKHETPLKHELAAKHESPAAPHATPTRHPVHVPAREQLMPSKPPILSDTPLPPPQPAKNDKFSKVMEQLDEYYKGTPERDIIHHDED